MQSLKQDEQQKIAERYKYLFGNANKSNEEGLRYDEGKPRFDLIPPEFLTALAVHLTVGAKKYAPRNWEKGMSWSKCYASLQRHAVAWQSGEFLDEETGTHHMVSVAWNAMALFVYYMREIGTNDIPR